MMLADSNVLLDWLTRDMNWFEWSVGAIEEAQVREGLAVNPLIYAEVSAGYRTAEGVERALPPDLFQRLDLPYEAAFLAGKAFKQYRRRGGTRQAPLPDFSSVPTHRSRASRSSPATKTTTRPTFRKCG